MPINEDHRAYLVEIRGLATDGQGREILVGLTFDETEEYCALLKYQAGLPSAGHAEKTDRYLDLHDKWEQARMQVLVAENQLRVDRPSRH